MYMYYMYVLYYMVICTILFKLYDYLYSSRQTSTNTRNHAHCQEQGCNEKDLGTKELSLEHINTIVHQVGEINLEWEESQVMKESSSDSSLAGQKTKVSFSD